MPILARVRAPPIQMKNVHGRLDIDVILRMIDACAEKNLLVLANQLESIVTLWIADANVRLMLMNVYHQNTVIMDPVNVVVVILVQETRQEESVIL